MPRPKRPHVVKRRIRGAIRYVVDLGMIDGKRIEKFFQTRQEADHCLADQKAKLERHGHTAFALTEEERILFQAARDRLARMGATISQAVDYFAANHRELKERLPLRELIARCCLDKELAGMDKRALQSFACSCRSFARGREDQVADTSTREQVKTWILGNGFAPKTQRNYLNDLRELFGYGVREGYMSANPTAGEQGFIQLAALEDEEITAFDLEQCQRLLHATLFATSITHERAGTGRWSRKEVRFGFRPLLGYVTAALFVLVRPEEIKKTPPEKIDPRERTFVVTSKAAKKVQKRGRQRRVITMHRTAAIWFRLWRRLCPDAPLVPKNFKRRWKALRDAAELAEDWPHDILRHTGASMHYAAFENRAALQALMGHSEDEDTLDRHYRAMETVTGKIITRKMGVEFWKLTPRRVRLLGQAQNLR